MVVENLNESTWRHFTLEWGLYQAFGVSFFTAGWLFFINGAYSNISVIPSNHQLFFGMFFLILGSGLLYGGARSLRKKRVKKKKRKGMRNKEKTWKKSMLIWNFCQATGIGLIIPGIFTFADFISNSNAPWTLGAFSLIVFSSGLGILLYGTSYLDKIYSKKNID